MNRDPEDEARRDQLRTLAMERIFLPSSPIKARDQLRGRELQYARTLETLGIPGRTAFIFGERGVGKSSLAWTAAYGFNSSDADPIRIPCHPQITFGRLVAQIAKKMRDQLTTPGLFGTTTKVKKVTELGLKTSLLTLMQRIETVNEAPKTVDVNDAVELLEGLVPRREGIQRVIIVDELDATNDPTFRSDIAYFIKQLGDAQSRLKFIFAGIAENVSELLAHHESAQRCMATIKLDRLPMNVLRDIVVEGFRQLGMSVKDTTANRIAMLSDGFAHFTHLIGLKMALAALHEDTLPEDVDDVQILEEAIRASVADSEAVVKDAYDAAVQKYASYEPVLWAVADHWELYRSTREIYKSYVRICDALKTKNEHVEVVDKKKLSGMLNKLKERSHGEALVSNRRSWFKIRVSMLRGYCRMVAATKGIKVGLDYLQSPPPPAASSSHGHDEVEDEGDD
jgi:uncharacterized protein